MPNVIEGDRIIYRGEPATVLSIGKSRNWDAILEFKEPNPSGKPRRTTVPIDRLEEIRSFQCKLNE